MRIAVSRSPNAERIVTPLELFFDLVYVFAIGQLSHHLLEQINLRTGAETVILALAVFYAWYMTAWGANWLEPDRLPVQLLLVGLMFVSLLMSVAIAEAFGGRAWLFVAAYLLLQVGRAAFLIVALRGRALGEHFVNVLVWELIAGGLWVAGAIAEGTARLARWGFAVAVNYGGAGILHWLPGRGQRVGLGQTDIAGEHLIERFRLFFLIVLGESVLTAGNAFTDEPFEVERLLALAIGFTGTVALWWCYLSRSRPPPRGPLRSSAGDAAATSSNVAQAAVTKPTRRRAAARVTSTRSASAVICGNGRRHSGAATAFVGPPGTRSTTSKATVDGKLTPACSATAAYRSE